jgi:hypothetical protein
MQNGYIESLNGKFRDECLNEHWFQTLPQARAVVAAWRKDFNEVRPTAAWAACRQQGLRSSIASKLSMVRKTNYPTAKSINLSTPDFLHSIRTEEGGRSVDAHGLAERMSMIVKTEPRANVIELPIDNVPTAVPGLIPGMEQR